MKVITEAIVREELKGNETEYYYLEEGKLLSPAAREYLQQRRIKIGTKEEAQSFPQVCEKSEVSLGEAPLREVSIQVPPYTDYESGAFYMEKPEHMTQLTGNALVPKNHLRIHFRGKLDTLQAMVILTQATLAETEGNKRIIEDLDDIKHILMDIMRCDILEEGLSEHTIIGLTHKELRERSHDPQKFFNIKQMTMPDYTMGKTYALLNRLRTAVRETEVSAADTFIRGAKCSRSDIIEEFNRLSSALHIMMCMYLAGLYR